jgi:transcriptional regulator with XRE-family HTH domain
VKPSNQDPPAPTTGVPTVDDLIDGVHIGDNVVVQLSGDAPAALFVRGFVAAVPATQALVVVHAGALALPSLARGAVVLDWTGAGDVAPPATAGEARAILEAADASAGTHAWFMFDSLTAIQGRWGEQAALDLFLWACPRLYRRRSVAIWLLDRQRHTPRFRARLLEITQVVVNVDVAGDRVEIETLKADGRPSGTTGRRARGRLRDGQLTDISRMEVERERLGSMIRALRERRGVAQAELARRVGVTPSALSQAERGVRSLSAENVMRVWDSLGVPFGPGSGELPGYRIARRGTHAPQAPAQGVSAEKIFDDPDAGTAWHLRIAARASGRGALFPAKTPEAVIVLRGVFQVEIGGHSETLHEGDTLVVGDAPVTGWGNPADAGIELLWLIYPPAA